MILDRQANEEPRTLWEEEPTSGHLGDRESTISPEERAARFGQRPVTVLLTGLTRSGKTTIATALECRLFDEGRTAVVLDGQQLRQGISKDLAFTFDDRSENLRRSAEIARLLNDSGLLVVAAFVAPSSDVRQKAAKTIGADRFVMVHLNTPLDVCRERDGEGHYQQADAGTLPNFPGVSAPYETPDSAALQLDTSRLSVEECVDQIMQMLRDKKILV